MLACSKNHLEAIKLLISLGASLSLVNKDGWNSFHIASRYNDTTGYDQISSHIPEKVHLK